MEKDRTHKPQSRLAADLSKLFKTSPTKIPKTARQAAAAAPPPVAWKKLAILGGAVLAIALVAHINSLWGGFVFNDGLALSFVGHLQRADEFFAELWAKWLLQPLTQQWLKATYAWDFQASGLNPVWFHAVNLCLHMATCLYLYLLVFRLSWRLNNQGRLGADPYHVAFAAAALLGCHPLATEPVAYVSARSAPLLGANYFLSLNCFLLGYLGRAGAAKFWGYALALVFMWIGLTASAEALTLPLTGVILALILHDPEVTIRRWLAQRKWLLLALIILTVGLPLLVRQGMTFQAGLSMVYPPALSYWSSQLASLLFYYLRCFFLPLGLSVDPPFVEADGPVDPRAIAGLVTVAACFLSLWWLRARPAAFFGMYLFLVGFIPSSLTVQPEIVSDRRFYLSLAGLCLLAGSFFALAAARRLKRVATVFFIVVLLLSLLSLWRTFDWSSELTLWQSTVNSNGRSARARGLLALELVRRGDVKRAQSEAEQALKLDPGLPYGYLARGTVLLQEKDYKGAKEALTKALDRAEDHKLPPSFAAACQGGLAEAYLELGDIENAEGLAQSALAQDQMNPRLHMVMGRVFLSRQEYQAAVAELKTAVRLNPAMPSAWKALAAAALDLDLHDLAYQAAVELAKRDKSSENQILLARAALGHGAPAEAVSALEPVRTSEPSNIEALTLLSYAEDRLGHKDKAAQYRNEALKIHPDAFSTVKPPPLPRQ